MATQRSIQNRSTVILAILAIAIAAAANDESISTGTSSNAAVRTASGADFDLSWRTVDGGGGTSSGGGFTVSGTIGQPDAGTLIGGNFTLSGGFWQSTESGCGNCPTDANDSGTTDAADLAQLLGAWGPVAPGNCLDSNGDNTINAADLAVLLGAWGPCP